MLYMYLFFSYSLFQLNEIYKLKIDLDLLFF